MRAWIEACLALFVPTFSPVTLQHSNFHILPHEYKTTDTDETEFRVAKSARDGDVSEPGTIPDGFYLCADAQNVQLEFQRAVIEGVRKVEACLCTVPLGFKRDVHKIL